MQSTIKKNQLTKNIKSPSNLKSFGEINPEILDTDDENDTKLVLYFLFMQSNEDLWEIFYI